MDRQEMTAALNSPPVQITMNDGSVHVIEADTQTVCGDITLVYLQQSPDDGKWRHVHLPLVTMASVVSIAPAS